MAPGSEPELNKLFRLAWKVRASGFDLQAGSPPLMQVGGASKEADLPALSRQDLERLLAPLLFIEQQRRLTRGEEVAFTYGCKEGCLFRVTVSGRSGQLRVSARRV